MSKTPGKKTFFKMHDPARVSHLPVRQSVRHPGGVEGLLAMPGPRVFGATPLDPWLNIVHPGRGASFLTLHNELSAFYELKCVTLARSDRGDAFEFHS